MKSLGERVTVPGEARAGSLQLRPERTKVESCAMYQNFENLMDVKCLKESLTAPQTAQALATSSGECERFVFRSPAPEQMWELAQNEGCDI